VSKTTQGYNAIVCNVVEFWYKCKLLTRKKSKYFIVECKAGRNTHKLLSDGLRVFMRYDSYASWNVILKFDNGSDSPSPPPIHCVSWSYKEMAWHVLEKSPLTYTAQG